jgi:hypothetical protein
MRADDATRSQCGAARQPPSNASGDLAACAPTPLISEEPLNVETREIVDDVKRVHRYGHNAAEQIEDVGRLVVLDRPVVGVDVWVALIDGIDLGW